MTRLVLLRHGESRWNVERRIQGQSGPGLSPRGRRQAEHTARFVAGRHPDALLASSDLDRCRETAAVFADVYGPPRLDKGLRERDFGDWTGRLGAEVARSEPARWQRWRSGDDVLGEIGGEDTPTLVERLVATVRSLVDEAAGRPVVCVTHGGPVWHGTRALVGVRERVLGAVDNCAVTELAFDAPLDGAGSTGVTRLMAWNGIGHLPADLQPLQPVSAPDIEDEQPSGA